MSKNAKIQQFASFCGKQRYAKFLDALRTSARTQGRLMFWQEQELQRFVATTGQLIPQNYEELSRLYCSSDRYISSNNHHESPCIMRFAHPVFRYFHSVNQAASGGSHVTVFTVQISSEALGYAAVIRDECAPDEDSQARELVLDELQHGANDFFVSHDLTGDSLCISLVEFVNHEIDLKPYKFRRAIQFILEDLLCEQQCNRYVPKKTVGIPL
ncbi:MAG: hypothetical protein V4710_09265 [Verrucomicrobiota bacterium]